MRCFAGAVAERDAVAALEFALVAPLMAVMLLSVFDGARALIIWQQTANAAQAITQAAEKLSVNTTTGATTLDQQDMQNVMTTIYAEMPGLNRGAGTGIFPGKFSVTLSEIEYLPLCTYSDASKCPAQIPHVVWSSYLATPTTGAPQLIQSATLLRKCDSVQRLVSVAQFSNDSTRLGQMLDPTKVNGGVDMVLTPQVVADVQYQFTPVFLAMWPGSPTITFWASATLSTPAGGNDQIISFDTSAGAGNVSVCNPP
jgi:Flp pilus assembly protein TadG